MKKNSGYMTRALQARDPRYAQILSRLGHSASEQETENEEDELAALRSEYRTKMGKQAYHGWDAETLRKKMAEADAQ